MFGTLCRLPSSPKEGKGVSGKDMMSFTEAGRIGDSDMELCWTLCPRQRLP